MVYFKKEPLFTRTASNSTLKAQRENSELPMKPKKLTPIYSKKHAEIAKVENEEPPTRDDDDDAEHIETVRSDDPTTRSTPKTTKKKKSKKNKVTAEDDDPNKTETTPQSDVVKKDTNVKSMPANPFDFIWDTNNMMPKMDEAAIGLDGNKSILGGTVARLNENDRFSNLNETSLNEFSSVISADVGQPAKKKKTTTKKKKKPTDAANENPPNEIDASKDKTLPTDAEKTVKNRKKKSKLTDVNDVTQDTII